MERGKRLDGDRVVVTDHVELAPSCVFFMHTPTLNAITPKSYALHAHTNNAITSVPFMHTPTTRSLLCFPCTHQQCDHFHALYILISVLHLLSHRAPGGFLASGVLAIGESSVILLHPPLPLVGVSIGIKRGCQ